MRAPAVLLLACCAASAQPSSAPRDLPIVIAPSTIAIDALRRGVLLPFEIGGDLPDGTIVEYIAELMSGERVLSQMKGRVPAVRGRAVGELKLGAPPSSPRVRLTARAANVDRSGVAVASLNVPPENPTSDSCGGLVFEQAAPRRGIREFARASAMTISALISAPDLIGTVAPLRFGVGPVQGAPQRFWPVQLGIPLRKGVWRVTFTHRAPLPSGPVEVHLLRGDRLFADGCSARFTTFSQ